MRVGYIPSGKGRIFIRCTSSLIKIISTSIIDNLTMSSDSASSPSGSPTESISPATQYSLVFYTKPENVLWCPVKFPRHFSPGVARGEKVLFRQVDDLPTQSEADTPHEAPVEVHHGTTKRMTKCSTKGATKRRIEPPEAAANDLLKWHIPVSKHKMSRTQVMEIREIMFSAQTESLSAIKRELEQEFTKVALELKVSCLLFPKLC